MSDTWDAAPLAGNVVKGPATWDSAPAASPVPLVAQRAAVQSSDNGEEAAQALRIGRQTGINPVTVQTDLPGYTAHARAQEAQDTINDNPYIKKYIDGNPIAASVSGDDYEELRQVSAAVRGMQQEKINNRASTGLIQDIPVMANMLTTPQGREALWQGVKDLPGALFQGIKDFVETPGKVYSGEINLQTDEGLDKAIGFGIGIALGGGKIRTGLPEPIPAGPGLKSFDDFMANLRGMETRQEIDDFLSAQHPKGPVALLENKAASGADALDRTIEVAQESKTKQRDPALFSEAVAAHDPGNLHVDAGKIAELYQKEGKVPAEGDGLLGFVPGLAEKVETAAASGGEVTIPVADYVAHIDPAVHEGLKDSVRLHDDGVTKEETKEAQENFVEGYHGSTDVIAGFDPSQTRLGRGVFFAENPELASKFAQNLATDSDPVFIYGEDTPESIVNFVRSYTGDAEAFRVQEMIQKAEAIPDKYNNEEYSSAARSINTELSKISAMHEDYGGGAPNITKAKINLGRTYELDMGGKFDWDKERDAVKHALENNFNSVTFTNTGAGKFYTVFNKNQIRTGFENTIEATEKAVFKEKQVLYLNSLFKDAASVGITEPEFKRYSDKIARAEQHILDRAVALNRVKISQALSSEWKRQEATIRQEVETEVATTGPFAAEKFLRENKINLGGDNIDQIADNLAPLFGYESGDALRQGLTDLETTQAAESKGSRRQREDYIKVETARRMEERHGRLAEKVAAEAREIALADHTFDVLADEVRILANAAGITPPLGRSEMVAWAKARFERSGILDAGNVEKLDRAVAKGGREAEKALLKGDFVEAFAAKQRQFLAAVVAKEALKLQKLIDATEAKIDRFTSEQVIKSIDQTYLEQIREVLGSVGVEQIHTPSEALEPLDQIVSNSQGQLAVAPWLFKNPPQIKDMTVDQFRAFADSLKSMEHVGRWAKKVENARGEAELTNVVGDIVKELERFPFINQPLNPNLAQAARSVGRRVVGAHLLIERAFDYTDQFNPHGPLTEWLDRPLRDANTKEITLTEDVTARLRSLRDFTDRSINDKISNNLLRDANDKSGFLSMNRMNLRVLMLNMGNWSNMRKLVEGYGVNEADLRRFVDANASAKDVAWVNGIWDVFKRLKPEADEVQLKDTGVPVDYIPEVSWEIKGGKLAGGYYPLSYDKYNSDIQSRSARPLFDSGYMHAATPHRYTLERTAYSGAIDLTENFLQSKIQGMIHDIAFRLPVRNANKLIENQELRTAIAQRWGKETVDLLPGWIRDIANSHNLDETYAKDMVYAATLVRQNIINTLIGMNPGTFIKHGLIAAIMSADRVGAMSLASAVAEIGASGLWRNLKGAAKREDFLPNQAWADEFRNAIDRGEKGDNARRFVMESSPVMRNRQRQWEDSVRGALDAITRAGAGKAFADLRQLSAQYGRLAVAWSDQATAMPTWLAAYKKAYLSGESHADAVFIADKEVSRAHGSNFVGDQPSVTRLGNSGPAEFMKWFTSLYRFWNHNQNNQFQLVWDASAAAGGRAEPGASAASITRRIGYMMAIIAIEELAAPAKDDDGHGPLAHMLLASIRYFGGGWVGVREVTNAMAHGYEPSTGLVGTMLKAGVDSVKDLGKATGQKAGTAKDWIKHTATTIGFTLGLGYAQAGRTGQFLTNVATGQDRPQNFTDWRQGLRTGSSKARRQK